MQCKYTGKEMMNAMRHLFCSHSHAGDQGRDMGSWVGLMVRRLENKELQIAEASRVPL